MKSSTLFHWKKNEPKMSFFISSCILYCTRILCVVFFIKKKDKHSVKGEFNNSHYERINLGFKFFVWYESIEPFSSWAILFMNHLVHEPFSSWAIMRQLKFLQQILTSPGWTDFWRQLIRNLNFSLSKFMI